ncbi:MAG: helix-turn-helix transcriptional regulator [Phycisphaerae bacterium]
MQVITPVKAKKGKSHLPRILELVSIVQREPHLKPDQLAKRLKVDVRTFYRDIRMLNASGYGVDFNRTRQQYETFGKQYLPGAELTPDEAVALLILARHTAATGGLLAEPASRALTKIRSTLPAALRRQIDPLETHIRIAVPASEVPSPERELERKMYRAMAETRELRCTYQSPSSRHADMEKSFRFRPYELLFMNRAWYVVGYHSKHRNIRTMKLSRFTDVKITDRRFTPPTEFSIDSFFGLAWRMIRGSKRHKIKLAFDAEFSKTITETRWHPTQVATHKPDGTVELAFTVDGLDEIVWWILGMGPHCKVLEPKELATRVKTTAAEVAKQYK